MKAELNNTVSEWVSQELSRSDRPDLSSANAVVSGGKEYMCAREGRLDVEGCVLP